LTRQVEDMDVVVTHDVRSVKHGSYDRHPATVGSYIYTMI
jgi:hypothetical protein